MTSSTPAAGPRDYVTSFLDWRRAGCVWQPTPRPRTLNARRGLMGAGLVVPKDLVKRHIDLPCIPCPA